MEHPDVLREIGSEFWDVPLARGSKALFPNQTEWFQSGRHALRAVLSDLMTRSDVRTVGMPSWCCDSMVKPFIDAGVEVVFYPVTVSDGRGLKQDVSTALDCDALLVMGYFGWDDAPDLSAYTGVVIHDITHSLLSERVMPPCEYTFGSLRKWCGVWTGGFAWRADGDQLKVDIDTVSDEYVSLRRSAMEAKAAFMKGSTGSKDFLNELSRAEQILAINNKIGAAAQRDVDLAISIDMVRIREARRANARSLIGGLDAGGTVMPIFSQLRQGDCPLFVPVFLENTRKRDSLRRYLIERDVYCPVHWPISDVHKLDNETRVFYDISLSLICDQRYGFDDMARICDLVSSWLKTS